MNKNPIKYEKFTSLLNNIRSNQSSNDAELILQDIIRRLTAPYLEELWIDESNEIIPVSYWIFICNDVIDERESDLIKQILYWQEFNCKMDAKVKYLQLSDSYFYNLCLKKFKPRSFPALIISDTPSFDEAVEVNNSILYRLDKNKIIGFLNSIHREITIGTEMYEIKNKLFEQIVPDFELNFRRINNLISEGLIHRAFDEITTSLNMSSEAEKHFILLKSQFVEIEDNKIKGTFSTDEYIRLKNQVTERFIQFVQTINSKKFT